MSFEIQSMKSTERNIVTSDYLELESLAVFELSTFLYSRLRSGKSFVLWKIVPYLSDSRRIP